MILYLKTFFYHQNHLGSRCDSTSEALRSLLDELPVSCPRNCGWTGRRDALGSHVAPGPKQCIHLRLEAAEAR